MGEKAGAAVYVGGRWVLGGWGLGGGVGCCRLAWGYRHVVLALPVACLPEKGVVEIPPKHGIGCCGLAHGGLSSYKEVEIDDLRAAGSGRSYLALTKRLLRGRCVALRPL